MLISIITATFNSAKTIETTIQSMLGQTWQDWEYLIMDGGSTDDTLQIVRNQHRRGAGRKPPVVPSLRLRPEHVQDAILYFGRFPFRQKSTT